MFASSGAHNKSAWTDKNHNSWHEAPWHKKKNPHFLWLNSQDDFFVCLLFDARLFFA